MHPDTLWDGSKTRASKSHRNQRVSSFIVTNIAEGKHDSTERKRSTVLLLGPPNKEVLAPVDFLLKLEDAVK